MTIHNQEIRNVTEEWLAKLYRSPCSHRVRFFRILNCDLPFPSVAKLFLNNFSKITCTQYYAVDTLTAQLPDQQFKKWPVTDRRERFGRRGHDRPQPLPQT